MKTLKRIGIISYNIYCNFTNYGSALQSWALSQAIGQLGCHAMLVDYCPDILADKDPLNPLPNMWDQDEESRHNCELTLPAIRENYFKFDRFYRKQFDKTKKKYTSNNFNKIIEDEQLDGFVCGSDTIFCILEFHGFDNGYFANYDCMKNGYTVSYAASFGDAVFDDETYPLLEDRLHNFKALGLRENTLINYIKDHVDVPVKQVIDPTLLMTSEDYDKIAEKRLIDEKYILLYARRYDSRMEAYAENLAKRLKCKIVEISLRAVNAEKGHIMYYKAGVEEFLSLVKYSEAVVTNSFHGLIFGVQYSRAIYIFTREQADKKIGDILKICCLSDRVLDDAHTILSDEIDYEKVHANLAIKRQESLAFLKMELDNCPKREG